MSNKFNRGVYGARFNPEKTLYDMESLSDEARKALHDYSMRDLIVTAELRKMQERMARRQRVRKVLRIIATVFAALVVAALVFLMLEAGAHAGSPTYFNVVLLWIGETFFNYHPIFL